MPVLSRVPLGTGLAMGAALAALEAGVVTGPVPPVVMVALTIAAGAVVGGVWGWRGWPAAFLAGALVPLLHLTRQLLGLPDTIRPGTLDAVAMMGLFALAVSAAGFCAGVLVRQAASDSGA